MLIPSPGQENSHFKVGFFFLLLSSIFPVSMGVGLELEYRQTWVGPDSEGGKP